MVGTPSPDIPGADVDGFAEALRSKVDAEVRFEAGSRGAYATDGSHHRQVPLGAVVPRSVEAGAEAVEVCARFGAPVLSRGAGTSLAGRTANAAVVIDWTKYRDALISVDADARTCVMEPGIVPDELNRRLSDHRLQFGPKPSTHSHCALGGMTGSNSCGASAQAYGETAFRGDPGALRLGGRSDPPAQAVAGQDLRAADAVDRRKAEVEVYAGRRGSPAPTRPTSAAASRGSRAASRATTSTRCCPRTASTSPGPRRQRGDPGHRPARLPSAGPERLAVRPTGPSPTARWAATAAATALTARPRSPSATASCAAPGP